MMKTLLCSLALLVLAVPADAQRNPDHGITTGTAPASGRSVRYGVASAVLDFPLETVTTLVHDYGRFQEYLPHFRTSRVLSRRGNRAMVYIEVTAASETITLWAQTRVSSREVDGKRIVEARMTQGNLDAFVVRWELEAVGDSRTRVRFRLLADPDVPLPSSIFTTENERFARRVVRAMRDRLNQQAS